MKEYRVHFPWRGIRGGIVMLTAAILLPGCPGDPPPDDDEPRFGNTTDPTNAGASFIGSAACRACHPGIDASQAFHAHAHALKRIEGAPPEYPEVSPEVGVPEPPEGFGWDDIAYVHGGYLRRARFIGSDGFVLTTGTTGVDTQWNLRFLPNGQFAGFAPYEEDRVEPKPFEHADFSRLTAGARPFDPLNPRFHENRPGIRGTWFEPGVQCESCHGPGSRHVANPAARDIFVDTRAAACGACHDAASDPGGHVILAEQGYINHNEQFSELRASGGHASFSCSTCHDPHASVHFEPDRGIHTDCVSCHADVSMALHEGIIYASGDYVERMDCKSCHMPFATREASVADEAFAGQLGRVGDVRTHIFRINTDNVDFRAMFNEDLNMVRKDDLGRAAVTVDFVCLRCHNGRGNAFDLTIRSASDIGDFMHEVAPRPR